MTARTEMLDDGTIDRKKTLSVAGGLESLHVPFSLACRLVRVLRPVIERAMLAMFYPRQEFLLGGAVALEFIRDDRTRYVRQALEELAEELLRGVLVPPLLHQDIQHVPVLIYGPPQIVMFAFDREKYFIEVPLITGPRTTATELIGLRLAKLATPLPDGLVGHDHAALKH